MLANLTIPLTLDRSYWFQVSITDNKPVLKVLPQSSEVPAEKGNINGLLQQLHLTETKENKLLLHFLLSNNLPISKEAIRSIGEWLPKSIGKQELATIGLMMERQLPLTKEVFTSISALQSNKGVSVLLNELQQQLSTYHILEPKVADVLSEISQGGSLFKIMCLLH